MTESQLNARMALERKVIRKLIQVSSDAGWVVTGVDDGGEVVLCGSAQEIEDAVFSVDESTIFFKKGIHRETALIVLGNDGYDCIADCSTGRDFTEQVMDQMDEYTDKLADECEDI